MPQHSLPDALPLSNSTLGSLDPRVRVPSYDRSQSTPGIVHVGVGGFNRSHLCWYLDDLLEQGGDGKRWAEFGVGLLPADQQIHDALRQQDFLYGVLERDTAQQSYRVVGSLTGHAYAPGAQPQIVDRMAAPECEIVSLTVTEGGYFLDGPSGAFLAEDEAIRHDLRNAASPRTWPGLVAEAAAHRMQSGGRPFTLLSCDNLQSNGEAARTALLAYSALRDDRLHQWIAANVTFPNSMVDRITPRTTDADREDIAREFGVRDLSPVVTEPFRQWVLEDAFAAGRPMLEDAGVKMTTDVAPYERTKMRLLNGGHFCIAYCSALLDIAFVADALGDAQIHALLTQFLAEVRPTLQDLPGIDLASYCDSVVHRFANATIRDQIPRICSDGSAKLPKFILPSLADLLAQGRETRILPMLVASWLHYLCGATESGRTFEFADSGAAALAPFVHAGGGDAAMALAVRPIFGDLAATYPAVVTVVQRNLDSFRTAGVRATLASVLHGRHA
jgi:mannitol 2-dehydrogenase